MSISSRITEIEQHITNAYDGLEDIGADLTNIDKNINNISTVLDNVWNDLPKVTATDVEEASINGTKKGRIAIDLKGNIEQEQLEGKNLLPNNITTQVVQGVTITKNDDGTLTINGTSLKDFNIQIGILTITESGNYTLTGCPNGGSYQTYFIYNFLGSPDITDYGNGITRALTENANLDMRLYIRANQTFNNIIFKPMLEKGSTVTSYEPYCGGTPAPNPSYDIPIHNVKGSNELKIQSKNLFNKTFQKGYWKTDGTYYEGTDKVTTMSTQKFKLKAGTYVVSNSKITNWQWYIIKWINDVYTPIAKNAIKTFTLDEDTIVSFQFNTPKGNGVAVAPYLEELTDNMMLEQGTTPTSYVPHQEQNLPLDLRSKNLYDTNFRYNNNISGSGGTITENEGEYSLVASKVDAHIWYQQSGGNAYNGSNGFLIKVEEGVTYTITITNSAFNKNFVISYDENKISKGFSQKNTNQFTITAATGVKYISLRIGISNATIGTTYTTKVQVEEGTEATDYVPYYNYELSKNGDAQDYISKENGKWYINEEIEKIVLDGTETEWAISGTTTGNYRFSLLKNINLKEPESSSAYIKANVFSNRFLGVRASDTWEGKTGIDIIGSSSTYNYPRLRVCYVSDNTNTLEKFKSWLSNHNTEVYYLLQTPTKTEITETPLINQLEAIRKAQSYNDQTNINQTNEDLPFKLDITVLKK